MATIYENQFAQRAFQGVEIGTIDPCDYYEEGKKIATAEFFQIFFYGALAVIYILSSTHHLKPEVAGLATLSLLPFEIVAYYKTMTLYGRTARGTLTFMAMVSLAAMAAFSMMGMSGDYSWTMCGGGFLVHTIRMISEKNDYNNLKKHPPEPLVCSRCKGQV